MRPLYKSANHAVLGPYGNRGLWFDKFCDQWRHNNNHWTMKADNEASVPKIEWLHSVLAQQPRVGDKQQINTTTKRMARLVHSTSGRLDVFRTDTRFVTGLGRSHPLENGFAWHPTLGTPYLPGSSIKGLIRAWARSETEVDQSLVDRLLGGTTPQCHAGVICFLDALPITQVELQVDVLTPHYAAWSDTDPPGDWRSPIPVQFLVVAPKQPFVFAMLPKRAADDTDLDVAFDWLNNALRWEGAGAKTAVGYGRFSIDTDVGARVRETERSERMQTLAGTSSKAFWSLKVESWSEQELLNAILDNIQKNGLTDPNERATFVAAVRAIRSDWLALWKKKKLSDPCTKTGAKKCKERAKLIEGEP